MDVTLWSSDMGTSFCPSLYLSGFLLDTPPSERNSPSYIDTPPSERNSPSYIDTPPSEKYTHVDNASSQGELPSHSDITSPETTVHPAMNYFPTPPTTPVFTPQHHMPSPTTSTSATSNHYLPAPPLHHTPVTPAPSLYTELQSLLSEECKTPSSLLSVAASDPQVPISVRMGLLQGRFLALETRTSLPVGMRVQDLQHVYRAQAQSTESARLQALRGARAQPWYFPSINAHYDAAHEQLIARVERSLDLLDVTTTVTTSSSREKGLGGLLTPPEEPLFVRPAPVAPPTSSAPQQPASSTPHRPVTGVTASTAYRAILPHPAAPLPPPAALPAAKPAPLPARATRVLTAWYERHSEHPYPSYETAEVLARAGGITVEQAKKWFSNKRRRAGKTKTLTEIARRRKRCREEEVQAPAAKQLRYC